MEKVLVTVGMTFQRHLLFFFCFLILIEGALTCFRVEQKINLGSILPSPHAGLSKPVSYDTVPTIKTKRKKGPWDYIQTWDVERLGEDLLDEEIRQLSVLLVACLISGIN